LNSYVDKNSGFIVEKNTAGTTVKSYELPGLWNYMPIGSLYL
jgi:hypothetical protein